MDDRQVEGIKEGAGLDESRVNQDFVDFLRKWSQPVLLIIVVVSAGWFFWQRYQQHRVNRTNNAFAEFEAVAGSPDPLPASLRAIAETYGDVGSVSAMANLRLGDVHMSAVRRGLEPGSALDAQGNPENDADLLDEAGREDHLGRASTAYRAVVDATAADPSKAVLTIAAHYGLAAVAESRSETDAARAEYERIAALADETGLTDQAAIARARIASLNELPATVELPSRFDLPALPGFPAAERPSEEPATEEPATEAPAAEEPAMEDPATDEPATADPAADPAADTQP